MDISRIGITVNDRPSKGSLWLFFGMSAFLFMGAWVLEGWRQAPDATTAMATGQYALAYDYYQVLAEQGDANAQNALGNLSYLGMGTARNYWVARDRYYQSAAQGHAAAQLNLGHLYNQGLGVAHDPIRAFGWYNMADKSGDELAGNYLRQIASEASLTPLMIGTAQVRWSKLEALLEEEL